MGARSRCRAAALALLCALAAPSAGAVQDPESRADYIIQARLDAEEKLLDGSLRLAWTNHSGVATDELWFHLYHNAFSNNRSTHLTESGGQLRGVEMKEGWGWQRVSSLRVGGEELASRIEFEAPDDGNPEDRTVFRVRLDEPVESGETLEVEIDWESQIPRVRRRTGYKDDFLLMAHWFPKLGVFEGERGWNCHQFHMNTEFYADYGRYDVTLDLPVEYKDKVATSGVLHRTPTQTGDRVKMRFLAPSLGDLEQVDEDGRQPLVHGFAWAADPDFFVQEGTFRYEEWEQRYLAEVNGTAAALGVEKDALRLRDVRVRIFLQPERAGQWQRHFDATCTALFFYGLWYGGYPYETVCVIDPAWGGSAAAGMEYPTLFTCGTALFTRPQMYRPESVTVHEAGHQFWYGLVGNNEFEAAWLDEGLNSYSDSEALFRRYGPQRATTSYGRLPRWGVRPAPLPGGSPLARVLSAERIDLPFTEVDLRPLAVSDFVSWWRDTPRLTFVEEWTDPRWSDRSRYLRSPDSDPIDTPGWLYVDRQSYSTNSYPRTAVALRSLIGVVGREAFQRGMRRFSDEWRYRHPYPEDFYAAFVEGEGLDIQWYFDEMFRGTGTVDWQVDVSQERAARPAGLFPGGDGTYAPYQEPAPADGGAEAEGDAATGRDAAGDGDAAAEDDAGASQAEEASGLPEDPMPEPGDDQEADATPAEGEEDQEQPWEYDVVVRAHGSLSLPLVIEVTYEDGEDVRFLWTREQQVTQRWLKLPLEPGQRKLKSVVVDPERLYYVDTNMSNNQWFEERERIAPLRWGERVWTQYSQLLHWYSSIGG